MMKKTTSAQGRKQRRWLAKAPLHARKKMISSALSAELKEKYNTNALSPRKGDTVKLMRGALAGHTGEVTKVDISNYKIYVSGVTAKKTDGKDVEKPVHPSNVMITQIFEEDRKRRESLSRTQEAK